jgi:hypothetical protein
MDRLEEIHLESIPALRDIFLVDWPRYCSAYYTIDNYINWIWLGCVKFYCLNGDWKTNRTFIIKVPSKAWRGKGVHCYVICDTSMRISLGIRNVHGGIFKKILVDFLFLENTKFYQKISKI